MHRELECEVIYKDGTTEILKGIKDVIMPDGTTSIVRFVFEKSVDFDGEIATAFDDIIIQNVKKFSFHTPAQ